MQQQPGAGYALWPEFFRTAALRPRKQAAPGVCRIDDRQQVDAVTVGIDVSLHFRLHTAKQVDRTGARKLRTRQAFDKITAAHTTGLFHARQDLVDRAEAAAEFLRGDHFTADHAVTIEQHVAACNGALGIGQAGIEQALDERPAATCHCRRHTAAFAAVAYRSRTKRSQGREGIVGDLARPHQVPQRRLDLPAVHPRASFLYHRFELEGKRGASFTQVIQDGVMRLFKPVRRRHLVQ